jgi:predicted small lipoprotein YifL
MDTRSTIAMMLLLATAGCGRYAAAFVPGHESDASPRHPETREIPRDDYLEECKWKRQLFC